jgi:hypothetical protein
MPKCPQCNKVLTTLPRKCPTCMADLDLLVDFVNNLQDGLERAKDYSRDGELGKAVWSYLAILEVDPDNPEARRQVSQVATAVRQFDQTAPKRRWLKFEGWKRLFDFYDNPALAWVWAVLIAGLIAGMFVVGYVLGTYYEPPPEPPPELAPTLKEKTLGK